MCKMKTRDSANQFDSSVEYGEYEEIFAQNKNKRLRTLGLLYKDITGNCLYPSYSSW